MIKYVKDVDTGEIYPIKADSEKESLNNVPGFVEDDFPEICVNYSGADGANDIILDLKHQIKEERASKTVIHKYPIAKILCAAALVAVMVVGVVFGVRVVSNVQLQPITVQYSESTIEEDVPTEQEANHETDQEAQQDLDKLKSLFARVLPVVVTIVGIRFSISYLHHIIERS